MELECGAYTITGKKHEDNHDRYRLLSNAVPMVHKVDRGQLFGIFDGMGSTPRAADASMHVGKRMNDFFKAPSAPSPHQISKLLYQANQEIFDWGFVGNSATRHQGACAGTVAWLYDDLLHIFHAGDTVALLLSAESQEDTEHICLTSDHADGHNLNRYFGQGEGLTLEEKVVSVADGDILVLMTDGVTNSLIWNEIAEKVRDWVCIFSTSHAAPKLCELARDRGSRDDITSVIVEIVTL